MPEHEGPARLTISRLPGGIYEHARHRELGDHGIRRYHPCSFDFDSTPMNLEEPKETWDQAVKDQHLINRAKTIERLKAEFGERDIERTVQNMRDLGAKAMSLITYHNQIHEQARRAFVAGAYFPALVAACALGERILNHLILNQRGFFKSSPHYKRVYRRDSFDDWRFVIRVLEDWEVLIAGAGGEFLGLARLRNRSIHFNPEAYGRMRDDALEALQTLGRIIAKQFGYFGGQPWFIENTPGAQFIKQEWEDAPFVQTYIVPRSGFVGPLYGMELSPNGYWRHLDYDDYGDGTMADDQFAQAYREREHEKVVTRKMIERSRKRP